ncbi:methylated-DNA--[protein]-cysteine S-methyltransferase [Baekduia soli]|uniref:Methylated-DNA--protein-cysteine methyltransferase n=1 Tax=Baekduia soli TaxID=496014 RepID=A0A5B8U289_9ACTN|nr:methylated-DNA--[protein]-cysteine S-methyltransferase [Baekduia soli]QEC47083.1 methylated-DNA--[protein]-cysteine S-methyltransferase [Baekduia soli]
MRTYTLIGADGAPHASAEPGTLGGHRRSRIYGTLDCPGAARAIARGGYVADRVFFADAATAVAAGYRPCATCLPAAHRAWRAQDAGRVLVHARAATPIGDVLLVADEAAGALCEIRFDAAAVPGGSRPGRGGVLAEAAAQLAAYTAGTATTFDLPLAPAGGGPFERRVWAHVATVGHGATTTYGAIAAALGRPGAARAVGAANARNPLPIVVPCHRVIGAQGALTGYAGGLAAKRTLLAHEGALPAAA